jgi:hypothetical protein
MAKIFRSAYHPMKFKCPCGSEILFELADVKTGDADLCGPDWVMCPCCNRDIPAFIVWPSWVEGANHGKV